MTPHQIAEEEKRLRRAEAGFWLNKDQCPECHQPLFYNMRQLGFFKRLLDFGNLDRGALCSCGTRVVDLETHHEWSTYEVTPASGAPYSVTLDE